MDDVNDGSSVETPRRIEILTGAERRRQWSDTAKARIVAECLVPGAAVSKIARRHDVLPSQIYAWRKAARKGTLVLPDTPAFAAVEVELPPVKAKPEQRSAGPIVEIEAAGIAIHINTAAGLTIVERIIRALKAEA